MRIKFGKIAQYEITDEVVGLLRQYRQRSDDNETGGVLAGWREKSEDRWTVTHLSLPSHKNKSGWNWFQLDQKFAQKYVSDVFASSGGTIYYCGFWHTHPEPVPRRSPQDESVISDLFRNGKLGIKIQLGLIVGNQGKIYPWCQQSDGRIIEAHSPNGKIQTAMLKIKKKFKNHEL